MYPIALATLEVDENLKQMRFDLVPKQYESFFLYLHEINKILFRIIEESFWCNYFYRVSLLKQSVHLTALANENDRSTPSIDNRSK